MDVTFSWDLHPTSQYLACALIQQMLKSAARIGRRRMLVPRSVMSMEGTVAGINEGKVLISMCSVYVKLLRP